MKMEFALICEGSSDEGLVHQIERLCIDAGFEEARGVIPEFHRIGNVGKAIPDRLKALTLLEPDIEIVFIHRDSDGRDPTQRYIEITESLQDFSDKYKWIGVVPVQELEAWLLTDENGIRYVSENPNGRIALDLPTGAKVELIASPKEKLWDALVKASQLTGRKLDKFKKTLPKRRHMLVERMQENHELDNVPSWLRLCTDIGLLYNSWKVNQE